MHEARLRKAGLYCIIDRELIGRRSPVTIAEKMLAGGARLIQYRDKRSERGDVYRTCTRLRPVLRKAGALFIINDYPDIAVAVGADGVHVGVVARKGDGGGARAAGVQSRQQAVREGPLARAVEALDDDQSSHERESCQPAPRGRGAGPRGPGGAG